MANLIEIRRRYLRQPEAPPAPKPVPEESPVLALPKERRVRGRFFTPKPEPDRLLERPAPETLQPDYPQSVGSYEFDSVSQSRPALPALRRAAAALRGSPTADDRAGVSPVRPDPIYPFTRY